MLYEAIHVLNLEVVFNLELFNFDEFNLDESMLFDFLCIYDFFVSNEFLVGLLINFVTFFVFKSFEIFFLFLIGNS